jgi:hypothetical protein
MFKKLYFFSDNKGGHIVFVGLDTKKGGFGFTTSALSPSNAGNSGEQEIPYLWSNLASHPFEKDGKPEVTHRMTYNGAIYNLSTVFLSDLQIFWEEDKLTYIKFKMLAKRFLARRGSLVKIALEMENL